MSTGLDSMSRFIRIASPSIVEASRKSGSAARRDSLLNSLNPSTLRPTLVAPAARMASSWKVPLPAVHTGLTWITMKAFARRGDGTAETSRFTSARRACICATTFSAPASSPTSRPSSRRLR